MACVAFVWLNKYVFAFVSNRTVSGWAEADSVPLLSDKVGTETVNMCGLNKLVYY